MTISGNHSTMLLKDAEDRYTESPQPLTRPLPKADPFPLAALATLAVAAEAIHEITQAPLALCGQSVLAANALAVQCHADIELPQGQVVPISEFFVTVAKSGERKSSCDKEALGPVRRHEEILEEAFERDQKAYLDQLDVYRSQRKTILNSKSKKGDLDTRTQLADLGEEPKPPLTPAHVFADVTYQGLLKLMPDSLPGLGIFSAEGALFTNGYSNQEENKRQTGAGLSCLWDGQPPKKVTAGEGVRAISKRRTSMHLMLQPDGAAEFLSDPVLNDQGLLSRILITAPDSTTGTRYFKEASREARVSLGRYSQRIFDIINTSPPLKDGRNKIDPRVLVLTTEARQAWINFYNKIEERCFPGGDLEEILPLANKAAEHAARISAQLALHDDLDCREVGLDYLRCGIELIQHYLAESSRLAQASIVNKDLLTAEKALNWLKEKGLNRFALSFLYQKGPSDVRDKASARRIASILEDHGWVRHLKEGGIVEDQRFKELWELVS